MTYPVLTRPWKITTALLLALACFRPAAAEDTRQILLNSLDPKDKTYVGEQETTITGPRFPRPRSQRQSVYRKDRVLRIEFQGGPVIFDDGREQVRWLRGRNVIERGPSNLDPKRAGLLRRAIQTRRATIEQLPDDRVAGRPAYVLLVKDAQGQKPPHKVWIDRENYLQLRQDITGPDRTVSTYFTRIDFAAEPPAEKLAFTPPPGATEQPRGTGVPLPRPAAARLAQAWGRLLEPSPAPPGFKLRGYFRRQFDRRPGLVAVYDGPGNQTLSIFQGPALGMPGMSDTMARKGARLRVLHARKGPADVTVVGPLAEGEIQRVMDSMQ